MHAACTNELNIGWDQPDQPIEAQHNHPMNPMYSLYSPKGPTFEAELISLSPHPTMAGLDMISMPGNK